MPIKFLKDHEAEILGDKYTLTINKGQIIEGSVEEIEGDENTVDIMLEDGTILLYIPITAFDEIP